MIFLAQNVPPNVSGGWLWGLVGVAVGAGAILFAWNQLVKAVDRFTGKTKFPNPMQVENVQQCATKAELEKQTVAMNSEDNHLHARIGAVDRDARDRDDEIRADYNEKFQALPNEIVQLLRNTGAIK